MLPEIYRSEFLEDFHLVGSMQFPVEGLIHDSIDLDFGLNLEDLAWKFRYYPLAFRNFSVNARKQGSELIIDDFRGEVGESNIILNALFGNYNDTSRQNIYGNMNLESDLLDFNVLLNYSLPDDVRDSSVIDTSELREPPSLNQIEYPNFDFNVDIGELRFGKNKIFGMSGKIRSSSDKVFYLDRLETSAESGGTIVLDGQFNVASPWYYNFSADVELKNIDI